MHKQLIVLDFDHTVFNTTRYVDEQVKQFSRDFGITRADFINQRDATKECCVVVDIDKFVAQLPHDDKEGMHKLLHDVTKQNAKMFTYDDARPFVERHQDTFDILLLTHGNKELQTEKIKHSGLPSSLPYVITIDDKTRVLRDYVVQYDKIHFIDDKADNIRAVEEMDSNIETYFMKRPDDQPYGHVESDYDEADHNVTGLDFTI